MEYKNLFDYYINNSIDDFQGWDFSKVNDTDRISSSPLDWGYASEVLKYIIKNNVKYMLDMGTGGGEFLTKLDKLPKKTFATEGYKPNINIARKRLKPLGINVKEVKNNILDFEDNYFDLIINRHESYSESEVYRVLKDKGFFITQQVGSKNCLEINEILGAKKDIGIGKWSLDTAVNRLQKKFKIIDKKENYLKLRFYDLGAVLFYLKAIPWQIKDFNVNKYLTKLKDIHDLILKNGYFEVKEHRFFVIAKKYKV